MTAPKSSSSKRLRSPPSPNSILDRPALSRALDDRGISLKAQQITGFYQALHRQHYPDLDTFVENYHRNEAREEQTDFRPLVNDISRKKNRNPTQLNRFLLEFLKDPNNGFVTMTTKVDLARLSKDGTTTKLAVRLHDGHVVESVLMRYKNKSGCRASLCVSSQVGCAMGCTFCATATMGIRGNLTSYEILEQVIHANRILADEAASEQIAMKETKQKQKNLAKNLALVRNVVFMGMGEPLNNYDNVVEACRSLIDHKRWHLAQGKVTVSTVGVTPRIRDLTRDLPQVNLALSLHAPNQKMRTEIVPAAKAYKIEGLIDALDNHMMAFLKKPSANGNGDEFTPEQRLKESTKKRAMIEYVMCKYSESDGKDYLRAVDCVTNPL
jgi:adenine C2-methylase RlmN of 23S rRNA A2503 and tRNA A37